MMSLKRITKSIKNSLTERFAINKNIVYFSKYNKIIRGVLLEGTPYKNTKYVRDFSFPLFRKTEHIHLEYARRITKDGRPHGEYFVGSDEETAAAVLHALTCANLIDAFEAGCSAAQFLEREFPTRREISHPTRAYDAACAAALAGEIPWAMLAFEHAVALVERRVAVHKSYPEDAEFLDDVAAAVRILADDPGAFQEHIDVASVAAAQAHGFCAPTVG